MLAILDREKRASTVIFSQTNYAINMNKGNMIDKYHACTCLVFNIT